MKLNVGCGKTKWEDFINIDVTEEVKPDIVADIRKGLPYNKESIDEIYFIHTIEHIEEIHHFNIFYEFNRLLKEDGLLVLAYPDFPKVAKCYLENKRGQREFFKRVIYGRQLYPSDYHVSLIDTPFLIRRLQEHGFHSIEAVSEPEPNEFNTILKAYKGQRMNTREDVLREEIFHTGRA